MSGEEKNNSLLRMIGLALLMGGIAIGLSVVISGGGIPIAGLLVGFPIAVTYAGLCIAKPKMGLILYLHCSFFVIGLSRFLPPTIPYGLMIDAILGISVLGTIFKAKRSDLKRLNTPLMWFVIIWFGYNTIELINPEARSKEAWFYAVRGVSLYWLQVTALLLIWMNEKKEMERFIRIWLGWSLVAAFWGFKQQYIGLTAGENRWLDEGGRITHVLMGKLRSFSFYSDAGQFGAAMAHAALFSLIMIPASKTLMRKAIYIVLFFIYFWGFAVAGSRGPLIILGGGFFMYLFMVKNFKILSLGLIFGATAFIILKYTFIGQGNYQIQRIRSALDPNDASLLVRLENQKKLTVYMASRPIGGGIGAGGDWGRRFSPGSYLAETEMDSWYVKIWVETGIIGLLMHIAEILMILYLGFKKVFFLRDPVLRAQCTGLICGFFGVALASYGNQIFGQMPTGTILYFSMAFFYMCDKWDIPEEEEEKEEIKEEHKPNLMW